MPKWPGDRLRSDKLAVEALKGSVHSALYMLRSRVDEMLADQSALCMFELPFRSVGIPRDGMPEVGAPDKRKMAWEAGEIVLTPDTFAVSFRRHDNKWKQEREEAGQWWDFSKHVEVKVRQPQGGGLPESAVGGHFLLDAVSKGVPLWAVRPTIRKDEANMEWRTFNVNATRDGVWLKAAGPHPLPEEKGGFAEAPASPEAAEPVGEAPANPEAQDEAATPSPKRQKVEAATPRELKPLLAPSTWGAVIQVDIPVLMNIRQVSAGQELRYYNEPKPANGDGKAKKKETKVPKVNYNLGR